MVMKIKSVLFDMDGVIINTRPEIENFWHEWAGKAEITLSEEDIEQHIHGCPSNRTIEMLFSKTSDEFKKQIVESSLNIGEDVNNLVMPGFRKLIDFFDELNFPWGIVTSHTLKSATRIAEELNIQHRFKVLVTADQVERGKPFPDPYFLGTERIGSKAEEVLVFEDSISGSTAAIKAGNKVIGVNTPKGAPALLSLGVMDVIENFEKIFDRERKALKIKEGIFLG